MNLFQQDEQCVPSSKGASFSSLPARTAETIGTFARAIVADHPADTGRRAAHCGISVLVHMATIMLLLILPLLSSGTLHPYVRTQDLLILPIAPRSAPPRMPEHSVLPIPQAAVETANLTPAVFVTHRRDEGWVGATPLVDSAMIDPRGFTDGTGNVLGGVLSHAFTPVVLAVPRNDRQVVHSGGVVRQARLLSFSLQYPDVAKLAHISGKVILAAIIDTTGNVHRVHPLSGHPFLVAAAMDAVERARFKPVLLDGQPIRCDLTIEVNFRLPRDEQY
jgi:periplasmic protein TonB